MATEEAQPSMCQARGLRRPRRWLAAYVAVVAALALGTLALALWRHHSWTIGAVLWGISLLCIIVLAERYPIHWAAKSRADVSTAPLFAGALLLPVPLAILIGLLGTLIAMMWRRRPPLEIAFAAGEVSLEVGAAALLFHDLAQMPLPGAAIASPGLLAVGSAAVVFYLTNTVLVTGVISVQTRKGFMRVWLNTHRQVSAIESILFSLGFLGALLTASYPLAMVLIVPPLALCYSLLQGVAEKAALSEKLEEQVRQLKAYEKELVQAAKLSSVGTLASGVAHEVNNPLFVIMGRAEMLLESPEMYLSSPKAKQHVQVIHDMAERIEGIVGGLLGYTRCRDESGPVDLGEAAEQVLVLVEHEFKTRKLRGVGDWVREAPLVWGNRSELQQVLMNLVMNAMDAMSEGGTLTVSTGVGEGKAWLSVTDTGTGIDQRVKDHLFEPFFTTKEPGRGTGLGLYLSRKIVERHHGDIVVNSQPGQGTCVQVTLPRLAPDDAAHSGRPDRETACASRA